MTSILAIAKKCEHWSASIDRWPAVNRFALFFVSMIFLFLCFFGFAPMDTDFYQYLLHALTKSGLYPSHDWMASTASHNPFFDFLFSLGSTPTQIKGIIFGLYLVEIGFFSLFLFSAFAGEPFHLLVTTSFLFLFFVERLPTLWGGTPLLLPTGLPSILPNGLALLSLVFIARSRFLLGAFCVAILFYIHFAYAVLFMAALVPTLLFAGGRSIPLKEWVKCALVIGILGLIAAWPQLSAQRATEAMDMQWITRMMINVRLPHMNPFWESSEIHIRSLVMIFATYFLVVRYLRAPLRRWVLTIMTFVLVVVAVGFAAIYVPALLPVARPFVFRILPLIIGFLAFSLACAVVQEVGRRWPQWTARAWVLALICGPVLFWQNNKFDLRWIPESPADVELAKWLNENTTREETLIVPPDLGFVRIGALRSVYVDYKSSPTPPKDLLEWFRRIKNISGLTDADVPTLRHPGAVIKAGYQKKNLQSLLELAQKENVQWILVDSESQAMVDLAQQPKFLRKEISFQSLGGKSYALVAASKGASL